MAFVVWFTFTQGGPLFVDHPWCLEAIKKLPNFSGEIIANE
jgi:hypothetical protein